MNHCEICLSTRVRRYLARRGWLFRRVFLCVTHAQPSVRAYQRRTGRWV